MGIAILDAASLAKKNKALYEELQQRHSDLDVRTTAESGRQHEERKACQDQALVPFADVFGRIKNVDRVELARFADLPSGAIPNAEVRGVRIDAASIFSALVGGAAGGAAVGTATFAAVGALATASTGAAISGLSGAAATSAIMAWLGGGSIAAGGGGVAAGTTVLTGLVATPALLVLGGVLEYKGRQQRRAQQHTAAELLKVRADLNVEENKCRAVIMRSRQVRGVLEAVRAELVGRLPALLELVDAEDDYRHYDQVRKQQVMTVAALAATMVTVLSAKFVDDNGLVTDLSQNVVIDAKSRLAQLKAA